MTEDLEISCCPNCGNPLISTYIIPGSEWFCWDCKWDGGLFAADRKKRTTERANKIKADEEAFEKAREHYIPPTASLVNCIECSDRHQPHWNHATDEEKRLSEESRKLIFEKP